jgi:SNF2 family DNA or RNA helicase
VAWKRLAPQVALPATETGAVVWLPSSGGLPCPSPELRPLADYAHGERPPTLGAWVVAAIAIGAEQALSLLAALPETADESWPEVVLGNDLRYWTQAAKLALERLARQQYLPAVLPAEGGDPVAAWAPCLDDPEDAVRLRRLARAMPPLCRAIKPRPPTARRARVTPGNLPLPGELLDGFLASAVDGAVRCWGRASSGRGRDDDDAQDVPRAWAALLLQRPAADGAPPALQAPARPLSAFLEQYRRWMGSLAPAGDGGFRICLRLEPPSMDEEEAAAAGSQDIWCVRYFLQASDDPSLLVPAEAVWSEAGSTLHYLNRRFEQPQERLLGGLGKASRLFPPLEKSLQTARPSACLLTTGEAYGFLREAAPLLEGAGFGVLVPPWWKQRNVRLGLRLRVSPAQEASSTGLLGLDALMEYDWLLSLGDELLSRDEFLRLANLKVPLVRVRGQWVELRAEQVQAMLRFWQEQAREGKGTLGEALRLAQTAGEDGERAGLPVVGVSAEGWVAGLLRQLSGREPLTLLPPPEGFRGQLRPYQVNGMSWLAFLHRWGLGACLADDMGLGKTIQVLALLLADREQGRREEPSLLICPTSAVGHWEREVARFAPGLRVLVHYGLDRQGGAEFAAEADRHDLVISTYSLLYRDEETLAGVAWDGVILDEAQNIKNPATRQAQAARRLRASYRVALTGTPVENRLSELWSILDFLNPGYLGSQAEFRRRFGLAIERYHDPHALQQLKALVRPFILRRVKSDPKVIADLPEKLEMPVYYKLTQEQATLYQAVVEDAMRQIEAAEGIQRRGQVLALLLRLKQICNHPAHFLGDGSALAGRSGKLARLGEMLEEAVAAGDRALVFTQFAEMGQMLRHYLQAELHREVLFLHGGVPQAQRERMVHRFQEDTHGPPVFVLSLKAGGTALNLPRANHVFHFDRWWNPAVENQATDRAYRIGQTRTVLVHKFICLGTLEERIAELIESKKALAENVVESGEEWLTELSTEQLRELLVLGKDALEEFTA